VQGKAANILRLILYWGLPIPIVLLYFTHDPVSFIRVTDFTAPAPFSHRILMPVIGEAISQVTGSCIIGCFKACWP
jgi:hypothetical protein